MRSSSRVFAAAVVRIAAGTAERFPVESAQTNGGRHVGPRRRPRDRHHHIDEREYSGTLLPLRFSLW